MDLLKLLGLMRSDAEPGMFLGAPVTVPEDDSCGDCPAEDFLGRVLIALAMVDTATDDVNGLPAVTEGNVHDLGRSPGHLAFRLGQLEAMARFAVANGNPVSWD